MIVMFFEDKLEPGREIVVLLTGDDNEHSESRAQNPWCSQQRHFLRHTDTFF